MSWFEVFVLSLVEGITEFLPISSTGHMVLVGHFLGIEETEFHKSFLVIIQFAAILSVLLVYLRRLLNEKNLIWKLSVGFLPAAVIGLLLKDLVDQWLESVQVVAWALIVGGLVFLWVDRLFPKQKGDAELTYKRSFWIGCFQCLALIPGVSRSGATIVGGLFNGLNRTAAAEFSFLLALPTMLAASALKVTKIIHTISSQDLAQLLVGCGISFIVAWASIRFLIAVVTKYGFRQFGIYRIVLGIIVLASS